MRSKTILPMRPRMMATEYKYSSVWFIQIFWCLLFRTSIRTSSGKHNPSSSSIRMATRLSWWHGTVLQVTLQANNKSRNLFFWWPVPFLGRLPSQCKFGRYQWLGSWHGIWNRRDVDEWFGRVQFHHRSRHRSHIKWVKTYHNEPYISYT